MQNILFITRTVSSPPFIIATINYKWSLNDRYQTWTFHGSPSWWKEHLLRHINTYALLVPVTFFLLLRAIFFFPLTHFHFSVHAWEQKWSSCSTATELINYHPCLASRKKRETGARQRTKSQETNYLTKLSLWKWNTSCKWCVSLASIRDNDGKGLLKWDPFLKSKIWPGCDFWTHIDVLVKERCQRTPVVIMTDLHGIMTFV